MSWRKGSASGVHALQRSATHIVADATIAAEGVATTARARVEAATGSPARSVTCCCRRAATTRTPRKTSRCRRLPSSCRVTQPRKRPDFGVRSCFYLQHPIVREKSRARGTRPDGNAHDRTFDFVRCLRACAQTQNNMERLIRTAQCNPVPPDLRLRSPSLLPAALKNKRTCACSTVSVSVTGLIFS